MRVLSWSESVVATSFPESWLSRQWLLHRRLCPRLSAQSLCQIVVKLLTLSKLMVFSPLNNNGGNRFWSLVFKQNNDAVGWRRGMSPSISSSCANTGRAILGGQISYRPINRLLANHRAEEENYRMDSDTKTLICSILLCQGMPS